MTDNRTASGGWNFTDMGEEFDEHVAAHLPGYADVQRLVALVGSMILPPDGGLVADLGASTGRTAEVLRSVLPDRAIEFDLYDSDASMLTQALGRIPDARTHETLLPAPLAHRDADLTVALWLLQFIRPASRRAVLAEARRASRPSGAILIATKTMHHDARWQAVSDAALDDYKADRGVSPEDRAAKTASLRGVMQPPTVTEVLDDLRATGWESPTLLWRWHVWAVIGGWASDRAE